MTATTITIPASARKILSGADFAQFIARAIVMDGEALIRPSDVKMSESTANGAMGGKLTIDGFVRALTYKVLRLAWGNYRVEAACKDLPEFAQEAIRFAHSRLIGTRGITAGLLKIVVGDACAHTAALPLLVRTPKVKQKAVKVEHKPTCNFEEAEANALETERIRSLTIVQKAESAHERLWSNYGDTLARAMLEAREAVRTMQGATPNTQIRGLFASLAEEARETLLHELAKSLGMRLTRIPAKRTA